MKSNTHPDNYRLVAFKDMSNNDVFLTKSTVETKETTKIDGVEYPPPVDGVVVVLGVAGVVDGALIGVVE